MPVIAQKLFLPKQYDLYINVHLLYYVMYSEEEYRQALNLGYGVIGQVVDATGYSSYDRQALEVILRSYIICGNDTSGIEGKIREETKLSIIDGGLGVKMSHGYEFVILELANKPKYLERMLSLFVNEVLPLIEKQEGDIAVKFHPLLLSSKKLLPQEPPTHK